MVWWSPGTHLSHGARVGEGCKEVLTLFPRLDTHETSTRDPSNATERRQSRFLLNCTCRDAARGSGETGPGTLETGDPALGKWEVETVGEGENRITRDWQVGWRAVGAQLVFLARVNELPLPAPPSCPLPGVQRRGQRARVAAAATRGGGPRGLGGGRGGGARATARQPLPEQLLPRAALDARLHLLAVAGHPRRARQRRPGHAEPARLQTAGGEGRG